MKTSHRLPPPRTIALTAVAMVAFAANSVLCRLALSHEAIDPASFTLVRIASGTAMLWLLVVLSGKVRAVGGSWQAAVALFLYAGAFSFGYITLTAAAGALLLFGAVQAAMVATAVVRGERLTSSQWFGLSLALLGIVALLLPGATAPPVGGAILMIIAGVAWGAYSLMGRHSPNPLIATAGNFLRALPLAAILLMFTVPFSARFDLTGLIYAAASGAVASGLGYAVWYSALPGLSSTQAASVQLSVPVITALAGALTLGEAITWRLSLCSIAVLGGIALVIAAPGKHSP